eukprot:4298380-Prymnesium_polylepis.1
MGHDCFAMNLSRYFKSAQCADHDKQNNRRGGRAQHPARKAGGGSARKNQYGASLIRLRLV